MSLSHTFIMTNGLNHTREPAPYMALLVMMLIIICHGAAAQSSLGYDGLFDKYVDAVPVEKVFLHIDKDHYVAGEQLWFKVYLFDGISHELLDERRNVYVEFIDSHGDLRMKKVFDVKDGTARGDFNLRDSIADGNYLIRAYTNVMHNAGDGYFYERQVYVTNPAYSNYIRTGEIIRNTFFNRSLRRKARQYHFEVFPEGGVFALGISTRVAFFSGDKLGNAVSVTGVLVNSRGEPVADIHAGQHGLGYVTFTPSDPRGYQARVRFEGSSREQRFPLPGVETQAVGMQVRQHIDSLEVMLFITGDERADSHKSYTLLGHTRGQLRYSHPINFDQKQQRKHIPNDVFLPGITQLFLIDENREVMSSRMVYIKDRREVTVELEQVSISADSLSMLLSVLDLQDKPLQGNLSVSVTALNEPSSHFSNALVSNVLISLDLPGHFNTTLLGVGASDTLSPELIDLLMMTNNWQRFNLRSVLQGDIPSQEYEPSVGFTISGQLINPANDKPVPDHGVNLVFVTGEIGHYSGRTNKEGVFAFTDIDFRGMQTIELNANQLREGVLPRINLEAGQYDPTPFSQTHQTRELAVTRKGDNWQRVRVTRQRPYHIPQYYFPPDIVYRNPTQTVYVSDQADGSRYIGEILVQRFPGVRFSQGGLIVRGHGSIWLSNEPMLMIDGTRVHRENFLSMKGSEIHRIDLFAGANTAIFGVNGANGVIIAYTRRGGMHGRDMYEYHMTGFAEPNDFQPILLPYHFSEEPSTGPTLLWDPQLQFDAKGQVSITYPMVSGYKYNQVVIEGVGLDGRPVSVSFLIGM